MDNNENYLSGPVVKVFREMLKVKSSFEKKAVELDGMDPPKPTKPAAFVEIYPTLSQHTEEEKHFADRHKDPEQDKSPCNKDYPEDSGITGGFCHISCMHGIMKGATALRKGESPGVFVKVLVKRLPNKTRLQSEYLSMTMLVMPTHGD